MVEEIEFGPYLLQRLVGRGGMGEVFEAHDTGHDRQVALKRLAPTLADDDEYQRRFRRESRTAARLNHPHVIPLHTFGEIDGRLFIDMRLVRGWDLDKLLAAEGPQTPVRTAALVEQVAGAIDAAHRAGLVHRDVKPSNVLIDRDVDSHDFVYLVDFGITQSVTDTSRSLTSSNAVVGSLDYMAPEQFDGQAGPEVDVYSLGCVVFQCLTGTKPFVGDSLPALMRAHLTGEPPLPSVRGPLSTTAFDEIVVRALAKDPADRFGSAAALAAAVREAAGGVAPPTVPSTAPPPRVVDARGGTDRVDVVEPSPTAPAPTDPFRPGDSGSGAGGPGPGEAPPRTAVLGRRRRRTALVALATVLVTLAVVVTVLVLRRPVPAPAPVGPTGPAASADRAHVVSSFPVPAPQTVAVDASGSRVYVTAPSSVLVFDAATDRRVAGVTVPGSPQFVLVAPSGHRAYVSVYDPDVGQNVLAVLDTDTDTVGGLIPTGQKAPSNPGQTWLYGLAVTPDGSRILVPDHDNASVSEVDAVSDRVLARIPTAETPHWVAVSPDGRTALVTNHHAGVVSVLDTARAAVVGVVPIGAGVSPHSIAFAPDGRLAEVTEYDAESLAVIDVASRRVVATVPVGDDPQSVAFAPDGRHSYVVNHDAHTVSVVDTGTRKVTDTVPVGAGASMIAVSPDGRRAYVTEQDAGRVSVLDLTG